MPINLHTVGMCRIYGRTLTHRTLWGEPHNARHVAQGITQKECKQEQEREDKEMQEKEYYWISDIVDGSDYYGTDDLTRFVTWCVQNLEVNQDGKLEWQGYPVEVL